MTDGSIVYEVRVDSGNVSGDLAKAGSLLERGTNEINRLAVNTAQVFGKILGDVFGNSASYAGRAISKLGTGLDKLKNSAAPLASALAPVSKELEKISKLSLPNVGEVTGKAASKAASKDKSGGNVSVMAQHFPSFASGTSYIPYDDFPALLHKGEAVLTANENAALKAAGGIDAMRGAATRPVLMQNNADFSALGEFGKRPVEVTLKIGEYEFTQIIADTMNNLYRQWGMNPLK
ncbi:MAG: hypothetical protein LBC82_08980 [Oscillospiraceae bacterium]|jgi:hypothetical protein|nr:hypothetical protein [Oscillospiraceae bacterium]